MFRRLCVDPKDECLDTVKGMNSRATQLKCGCPRMSHYASHYHYGSQSIAFSCQWECWTGWSQPVNCINLHKHRHNITLLSEPTVHSLYCGLDIQAIYTGLWYAWTALHKTANYHLILNAFQTVQKKITAKLRNAAINYYLMFLIIKTISNNV